MGVAGLVQHGHSSSYVVNCGIEFAEAVVGVAGDGADGDWMKRSPQDSSNQSRSCRECLLGGVLEAAPACSRTRPEVT